MATETGDDARKRPSPPSGDGNRRPAKRKKTEETDGDTGTGEHDAARPAHGGRRDVSASPVRLEVLGQYYPRVETLRAYLLTRLPASSRIRRKKLAAVGKAADPSAVEQLLGSVLDTALVAFGVQQDGHGADDLQALDADGRQQLRESFSQTRCADESYVSVSHAAGGACSPQAEIVDFAVWLLFKRTDTSQGQAKRPGISRFPANVLCHGFQRAQNSSFRAMTGANDKGTATYPCTVPGLFAVRPTQSVQTLKEAPWPQMLALLGASGEKIMTHLLLDCALFLPVDAGHGNYIQLTGKPLFDMIMQKDAATAKARQVSEVTFVRSRMFYVRPSVTTSGSVHFGLKHIHVLNRFPFWHQLPQKAPQGHTLASLNQTGTLHTAMYMFPRQFGLHNVFTSAVDRFKTAQKFQDYTAREEEIGAVFGVPKHRGPDRKTPIPRRLRGMPLALVEKMRILHGRCAYHALLEHYCPTRPGDKSKPLVSLATPLTQVSAFCQAVFRRVIPNGFWGSGDVAERNRTVILGKVDEFIRLLRYETMNLHGVLQGLKIAEIEWLAPPELQGKKASKSDMDKRREILAEFLYYLFDSFLIPLICGNFYVTESNTHRNRLFYFRHDVWRLISEPAWSSLKADKFEEVKPSEAARILGSRDLSYSQIRLLPKQQAMRTITNLRRRAVKKGDKRLTSSTNTVLAPVAAMLNLEMKQHPERLGSAMLSIRGMYSRLKEFKTRMAAEKQQTFYFAKVDVKSAFDTIPQEAMVTLLGSIVSHPVYHVDKHVEVMVPEKPVRGGSGHVPASSREPERTWRTVAKAGDDASGFHDAVEAAYAPPKQNTVFIDSAFRRTHGAEALAMLAAVHIQQNIVKIGKKYYRQKEGIPQGSVLSSTLCSYFYADLEEKELAFLKDGPNDCLLLRLIDDFLLITTNRAKAARFVAAMQRGHPRYGVAVNPAKSLVNFALQLDGQAVPRLAAGAPFPYCGTLINCATLDLARDRESKKQVVFDTLTVEHARAPGYHFRRKIFSYFKIQTNHMFFDTAYNTRRTTLHNLHSAFAETAGKMWAYARCLPKAKRPRAELTISTIEELGELAYAILGGKSRAAKYSGYQFAVSKPHLKYIMLHAFLGVLRKKQTGYRDVVAWIADCLQQLRSQQRVRLPKEYM